MQTVQTDVSRCQVAPLRPKQISLNEARNFGRKMDRLDNYVQGGCVIAGVVAFLTLIAFAAWATFVDLDPKYQSNPVPGLVSIGVGILVAFLTINHSVMQSGRKAIKLANLKAGQDSLAEAERSTQLARSSFVGAFRELENIGALLATAERCITNAQAEYEAHAFSPFWDEVEHGLEALSTYGRRVRSLGENSTQYVQLLESRTHDFPEFPITSAMIPDGLPVASSLRQVIRQGEKNFEFAMILEQRKNRAVMIAGFRSIVDAVNGIEGQIRSALSDCEIRIVDSVRIYRALLRP